MKKRFYKYKANDYTNLKPIELLMHLDFRMDQLKKFGDKMEAMDASFSEVVKVVFQNFFHLKLIIDVIEERHLNNEEVKDMLGKKINQNPLKDLLKKNGINFNSEK